MTLYALITRNYSNGNIKQSIDTCVESMTTISDMSGNISAVVLTVNDTDIQYNQPTNARHSSITVEVFNSVTDNQIGRPIVLPFKEK